MRKGESAHLVNEDKCKIRIKRNFGTNVKLRPHLMFSNWKKGFQVPWICFLECAMFIVYLLIGYACQYTSVLFARDFALAIDDFFLSDSFEPDEDGNRPDVTSIYLKKEFAEVASEISKKFLLFTENFPCSNEFVADDFMKMSTVSKSGEKRLFAFNSGNISLIDTIVNDLIDDFQTLVIEDTYVMFRRGNNLEEVELGVKAVFSLDLNTKIITLDFSHTRMSWAKTSEVGRLMESPLVTLPLLNAVFGVACILLTTVSIVRTYTFSRKKAQETFESTADIFRQKVDKWGIYGLISHLFGFVVNIVYALQGSNYQYDLPPQMAAMSLTISMHFILLIRYLRRRHPLKRVINMLYRGILAIIKFHCGCIIILGAYTVLGFCLFGTYDETWSRLMMGPASLIGVVHGDAIQDRFDAAEFRADVPAWMGIVFWMVWVFFSLTIMFNIGISIFEESLEKEVLEPARDQENEDEPKTIVLPLRMRINLPSD